MKKKLVAAGLLAGAIALTGLGGAAYAAGSGTFTGPAKPHGADGKMACVIKLGPGKPGKPGEGGTGNKTDKQVFSTGGDTKGLPPLPPTGAKVVPGEGGKMTVFPPPGDKPPKGAAEIHFNDAQHPIKGEPGSKGVRCSVVPGKPGALPPGVGVGTPPLPTTEPTPAH